MGGTEFYLKGLLHELRAYGITSLIVAPLGTTQPDEYEVEGTTVRTYSVNENPSRAELRGEALHRGFDRFRQILDEKRADIYHQHSWTRGLGGAHLRAAREAGFRTVLTVHTPNVICLRGTMMRFGEQACDGRIDSAVCGACWAHDRGAPKIVARSIAAISPAISAALEGAMPYSRFATALSARTLGESRRKEFARMVADADRIVAVCDWLFEALALNGVPTEKLVLSRQGVDGTFVNAGARGASSGAVSDAQFRLLYLGRWHPVKGVDVLVNAVRAISPEVPVTLSIHGVGDGIEEQAYASHVRRLAAGDARITIGPPIPRERIASTLATASALAVPSLWLETGPLVVLEAKAVGLPVIGSRLGGIAELVREPEDGVLVPPADVRAWATAITTMASNHATQRHAHVPTIFRTMREVAGEMTALYSSLC